MCCRREYNVAETFVAVGSPPSSSGIQLSTTQMSFASFSDVVLLEARVAFIEITLSRVPNLLLLEMQPHVMARQPVVSLRLSRPATSAHGSIDPQKSSSHAYKPAPISDRGIGKTPRYHHTEISSTMTPSGPLSFGCSLVCVRERPHCFVPPKKRTEKPTVRDPHPARQSRWKLSDELDEDLTTACQTYIYRGPAADLTGSPH